MLKIDIKTSVTKHHTTTITDEHLRKAFGIPKGAEIFVMVPGGGDWSNESLDIQTCPIEVRWTEHTDNV